jgi:predicted RND superfamily exporter protein
VVAKVTDQRPVIRNLLDFDRRSGSLAERLLFNNRPVILFLCALTTIFLGFEAMQVQLNASFEKMIPLHQQFIVNYYNHYSELQSQGDAIEIAVQADRGTIINAHYLDELKQLNDRVYLLPNVDRAFMTSLWTSNTRWVAVVSDGLASGPVINNAYDGSPAQLALVAQNIAKTGKIGELVSNDFTSSMIYVPLLQYDGLTGKPINYGQFAAELEGLRQEYAARGVTLHIIGFGMVVGDMINGIGKILTFLVISVLIAVAMLFWFTRCIRSTLLVVFASLIAVTWDMGFLSLLGYDLTPYSVLVPFLIFAIGMSHGAQKMNGVMQDIGRGAHPLVAARQTFRRLFLAGFAALVCDAASFAVLLTIQIAAIRELALLASIGVAILIFTNLVMLPMIMSYTGVSKTAATRSLRNETLDMSGRVDHPLWHFLDKFTQKKYATGAIAFGIVLCGMGLYVGRDVQIGDLGTGAPELRQNSQYNKDNNYIIDHYSTSNDVMEVMVDTPQYQCLDYTTLYTMDNLQWQLDQMPQVQSTLSLGSLASHLTMLMTENSSKWYGLDNNQQLLNDFSGQLPPSVANLACSFMPIYIYLVDHKAATLNAVVNKLQTFINNPINQSSDFKMSLLGGNAGIETATNIVIGQANEIMLVLVYSAVVLFCLIVFRSWRAMLCAVLPLTLTSILAQALMVWLHIGIKVATLPVIALGVGIGVDYALYVLSIVMTQLRKGATLSAAYHRTLLFTGKVVVLTGFTLAAGVVTWIFAPIKFQADMGLLLSFMFLWNMLGAMILLPSLAYFLLPPHVFATHTSVKRKELKRWMRPHLIKR